MKTGLDYGARKAAHVFTIMRVEDDGRLPLTMDQLSGLLAIAWGDGLHTGKAETEFVFVDTVQTLNREAA